MLGGVDDEARCVGRDDAMAALDAALGQARRRARAGVLVVGGPPGVGATCTVAAWLASARRRGLVAAVCTSGPPVAAPPWAGLLGALADVPGGLAAVMAEVDALRPPAEVLAALVAERLVPRLVAAADHRPVVCWIDGIDRVDAATAAVVPALGAAAAGQPLLVIATARAGGLWVPEVCLDALPPDAAARLEHDILDGLVEAGFAPAALAREQVLARAMAGWLATFEAGRRRPGVIRAVEAQGGLTLDIAGAPFGLKARADRIEIADGRATVLDFKTGQEPSRKAVAAGFYPQLTLTAAIVQAGGFPDLPPAPPEALTYVRLTGRGEIGKVVEVGAPTGKDARTAEELAAEALDGLRRRVEVFRNPDTPYLSWTAPQFARGLDGDYDVLARVWEWRVVGADGLAEEAS